MFKISDFSKLSHVSIRTLRYYDEIGLLKPVLVDNQTGYRYYEAEQLTQLHRILELKGMGFELSQIVHLLQENIDPEQLSRILELKLLEIQHLIEQEQEKQLRVRTYLDQLKVQGEPPAYEVILKKVDPLLVASSRTMITNETSQQAFARQMLAFLKENSVVQRGNALFIDAETSVEYRVDPLSIDETIRAVEFAVPVKSSSVGNIVQRSEGHILIRELAGVNTMATVLHRGTPYRLMEAYQSLGTWIEANGYAITGPSRRVFLQNDTTPVDLDDPEQYLTEVQIPVDRKRK